MFPDYSAFISYRKCAPNRVCDLGDDTSVPIVGEGTAVVRLNGKVILVRNALHIPALRQVLYSVRRHRHVPGCGVFSWYDEGSYLVFPQFCPPWSPSESEASCWEAVLSWIDPAWSVRWWRLLLLEGDVSKLRSCCSGVTGSMVKLVGYDDN